jgi:undecaprenyl phosphate-alpha-L-ara4FN deformylase
VGLHTYDHVRWQDNVAQASAAWTRIEFERGMNAFERVFGHYPKSHAAAGWQINAHALELEREYGLSFASDTRGRTPFWPMLPQGASSCPQLPTTLPTFDELLGRDGIDESSIADAVFGLSAQGTGAIPANTLHVFTLHAELEGMRLLPAFESLLKRWQAAGAKISRMAAIHERGLQSPVPNQAVMMGEVPGRSGLLAMQPP